MVFQWYFSWILKDHILVKECALEIPWYNVIGMTYFYILTTFQSKKLRRFKIILG